MTEAMTDPGASVSIRPMELADIPAVLVVDRSSFPTPWSAKAFQGELKANVYAHYFVAERDGEVVGYAGVWTVLDEAHVTNIAVHPDHRRLGIGRLLLATLVTRAIEQGCDSIMLEVRKSNHTAQKLYRDFGFEPRGIRRGYYTDNNEDAIIMWKSGLLRRRRRSSDALPGH